MLNKPSSRLKSSTRLSTLRYLRMTNRLRRDGKEGSASVTQQRGTEQGGQKRTDIINNDNNHIACHCSLLSSTKTEEKLKKNEQKKLQPLLSSGGLWPSTHTKALVCALQLAGTGAQHSANMAGSSTQMLLVTIPEWGHLSPFLHVADSIQRTWDTSGRGKLQLSIASMEQVRVL